MSLPLVILAMTMPSLIRSLKAVFPDRHPIRLGWHWLKAFAAAISCGFPARRLTVIAVTGTDGKTTTVAMTAHILRETDIAVGAVSTSFFCIGSRTEENPTHQTSMSPFVLQRFLRNCIRAGCTHAVVEISSHGLVQHRCDFLWPEVAAITNTSPEHLDYHGSMEQYRADKGILFGMLRGRGTKVINAEDETAEQYARISTDKTVLYSHLKPVTADIGLWLTGISVAPNSSSATLHVREKTDHSYRETRHDLALAVPGAFNHENALCAIGCSTAIGVDIGRAANALRSFTGVPGRMERIDSGQPFYVFVDFTVTPNAYEKTLSAIRAALAPGKRLLVLTGSCGNRMPEKRPMIGRIVGGMADIVVVSEDETVTEDSRKVVDEVWAGIDTGKTSAHKIFDRREGIRFLFKEARPGDAVALCGMGACTTMQTREGLRPWDERQIARELLNELV